MQPLPKSSEVIASPRLSPNDSRVNDYWLSAREAARYCGYKGAAAWRTLVRAVRRGRLHCGHNGRSYLFTRADLDTYLSAMGQAKAKR